MLGPATDAAAAAASAAAFFAQPASSTPVTSVVVETSSSTDRRTSRNCRANPRSGVAITIDAPWLSTSVACAGPPRAATARAAHRSDANADGSVPSGGTKPLESTSTPARRGIRSPWAAITLGSERAGTARHTRSWWPSSSSAARSGVIESGSSTPGR